MPMQHPFLPLWLSLLFFLCAQGSIAWAGPPPTLLSPPVPAMTLLMKQLGDAETSLHSAITKHDQKTLEALLAEEFEAQQDGAEVVSSSRREWIDLQVAQAIAGMKQEILSARELGDYAVVSLKQRTPKPNDKPSQQFLVDIWKKQDLQHWKLLARYAAKETLGEFSTRPDGKK